MTLSRYFDRIAIALSTICIVHCLTVPVLIAILPVAAVASGSDSHFHALMLWLVVPTSAVGFGLGFRLHRQIGVVALGLSAVVVLAAAALWGHEVWSPAVEMLANVTASFVLAFAHLRNFREVRRVHRHS